LEPQVGPYILIDWLRLQIANLIARRWAASMVLAETYVYETKASAADNRSNLWTLSWRFD